jgi:hypothetical protein
MKSVAAHGARIVTFPMLLSGSVTQSSSSNNNVGGGGGGGDGRSISGGGGGGGDLDLLGGDFLSSTSNSGSGGGGGGGGASSVGFMTPTGSGIAALLLQLQQYCEAATPRLETIREKHLAEGVVMYEDNRDVQPPLRMGVAAKFSPVMQTDRLVRGTDVDIEALAGKSPPPLIFRPIQFTLVPDLATDFDSMALALRHCDHLCTLLSYQHETVRNTYLHRLALITHVVTHVIPLPMPLNDDRRGEHCFYTQPLRYAIQVDILRSLHLVSRHFTACALSIKLTRSFDASRVLVASCIATMGDAIVRLAASDVPSRFCLHFNGCGGGPFAQQPYGFDISNSFAEQSQVMQFTDPNMVTVRTKVLDYFQALRTVVTKDHLVFEWEREQECVNVRKLIKQLCWDMGFPQNDATDHLYLSGEQSEMLDFYPEMRFYRDLVFTFKFMMAPSGDAFPAILPWSQTDARLTWQFKPQKKKKGTKKGYVEGAYVVAAFNRELRCVAAISEEERQRDEDERRGVFGKAFAYFFTKQVGSIQSRFVLFFFFFRSLPYITFPYLTTFTSAAVTADLNEGDQGGSSQSRVVLFFFSSVAFLTFPYLTLPSPTCADACAAIWCRSLGSVWPEGAHRRRLAAHSPSA